MHILEMKAFEGRNIYCHRPVIRMKLDLADYSGITTKELGNFSQDLLAVLPQLQEHYCSRGYCGGFVERLQEGTLLGHVVEHVALELQALAGHDVIYGKTIKVGSEEVYYIITEYQAKEGAMMANRLAVELVKGVLQCQWVDIRGMVQEITRITTKTELGPSTAAIARAAKERGIPVMRLGDGSMLQLGYGKNLQKVGATITGQTRCLAVDIACDKILTKEILGEMGIPVPPGGLAGTEEEAAALAEQIGYPVVVKPFNGNQGKGVSLNLTNSVEVRKAYQLAAELSNKIIIEKYIPGRHYRVLVVGDRVVAVSERIPAMVVGDGLHTINQLIELVNEDPLRGEGHEKPLTKIKIDPVVIINLARKGLSLDDIPPAGVQIFLRENANLSTGGTAIDVTDLIHPTNVQLALRAVKLIGLDVAGVDLVTQDIRRPITGANGAIIEVNAAPGIRMHHYPSGGQSRDAGKAIVDFLFPEGVEARIPIVAVTGTNGKTTVTRMLNHILTQQGKVVGMTTTDGIYINNLKIVQGDCSGPQSAKAVLRDSTVEVAVLETARGGILRSGLGYDSSDVGIITNISDDHLGQDGIETLDELAMVKALAGEAVHRQGTVVLNADDPTVVDLTKRFKSKIIYFSRESENIAIRRHLGAGGQAVMVRNGIMIMARGNRVQRIIAVKNIPAALGGIAGHNLENAMAAAAGALALGLSVNQVREGLASFTSNQCNPGRLNLLEIAGVKIILDYGHNLAGYRAVITMLHKVKKGRLTGVIGVPGDRTNESIIKIGQLAGKGFSRLYVKEDRDLRGRAPGEAGALLCGGALEGGITPERVTYIPDEGQAIKEALINAEPGDTVAVFYENLEAAIQAIKEFQVMAEDCAVRTSAGLGEENIS
ncbi:MAG: cyanophycin synthetase [Clostridia bacterium]|nr:cyanophycin synthetase [Clostridia bacterium]